MLPKYLQNTIDQRRKKKFDFSIEGQNFSNHKQNVDHIIPQLELDSLGTWKVLDGHNQTTWSSKRTILAKLDCIIIDFSFANKNEPEFKENRKRPLQFLSRHSSYHEFKKHLDGRNPTPKPWAKDLQAKMQLKMSLSFRINCKFFKIKITIKPLWLAAGVGVLSLAFGQNTSSETKNHWVYSKNNFYFAFV